MVLRSDSYRLDADSALHLVPGHLPFVDLDPVYKVVSRFEERFPFGPPSLKDADSLVVHGDWTFGAGVVVVGDVVVQAEDAPGTIPDGARL